MRIWALLKGILYFIRSWLLINLFIFAIYTFYLSNGKQKKFGQLRVLAN